MIWIVRKTLSRFTYHLTDARGEAEVGARSRATAHDAQTRESGQLGHEWFNFQWLQARLTHERQFQHQLIEGWPRGVICHGYRVPPDCHPTPCRVQTDVPTVQIADRDKPTRKDRTKHRRSVCND